MLTSDWCPLVSIIIPVYNGGNFLQDAIESALSQTYKNVEIIVVNDGSRDSGETEKIALANADKIRYFYKENGGVASALNFGISHMRGEYFSWLSHDDIYHPNKLSKQIAALRACGDSNAVIYCDYACIDENGNHLHDIIRAKAYSYTQLRTPLFVLTRGLIHGCGLLIHKSHFERAGLFNESLRTTQDYDLWFRILRNQELIYIEDILLYSRQHPGQDSRKLTDVCLQEGNELFIGFMRNITDQEKCIMDGNVYKFYRNMWKFLETTTRYDQAKLYAKKEMIRNRRDRKIPSNESNSEQKTTPMVTVAVYNDSDQRNLESTLSSLRNQTYKNIEIIIIHDVDTPFTSLEMIKDIKSFRSQNNTIGAALNLAIEKMNGEYFTCIFAGEQYLSDKIEKQIEVLLDYGAPAVVLCNYYNSSDGKKILLPELSCGRIRGFLETNSNHSLKPSSVLLPKYLFDLCGKFDESLNCIWDYDMWLRLNRIAVFLQISDALLITIPQEISSQEMKEIEKLRTKIATERNPIAPGDNEPKRWLKVLLLSLKKDGAIITLVKIVRKLRFVFR